jgi:hypothetical protein
MTTPPEESPERNRNYPLWQNCDHEDAVTDPDTGEKVCMRCALVVLDEAIQIGTRAVPVEEFYRRLRRKLAELDAATAYCNKLYVRIGGITCASPSCQAAPMLRSKWCPVHREQAERRRARERQAKHRVKARLNGVTPVTLLET